MPGGALGGASGIGRRREGRAADSDEARRGPVRAQGGRTARARPARLWPGSRPLEHASKHPARPPRPASEAPGRLAAPRRAPIQAPQAPAQPRVRASRTPLRAAARPLRPRPTPRSEPLDASAPPTPVSPQQPCVRFPGGLRLPSTDFPTFFRPQAGDCEVVPSCVHREAGAWASAQLRGLWIRGRTISTGCGQRLRPHPVRNVVHGWAHRLGAVVPSRSQLLHITVHCSATSRGRSLRRVKAVTRNCQQPLWETTPNLGTQLGRTRPVLGTVCAELSVLHR